MSVAERLPSDESVTPITTSPPSSIDNILRLALNGVGGRTASAAPSVTKKPEPDFGRAAELLDRATTAIATLTARRDELERAATQQEQVFAERLRVLQDDAAEWERRAKVIKAQLHDCENRLSEQQVRIETLTYRAENAEARAVMAEQMAADARKQAQLYHDKIISTLGTLA